MQPSGERAHSRSPLKNFVFVGCFQHDETRDLEAGIILKFRANNRFQAIAKAVLLGIVQA